MTTGWLMQAGRQKLRSICPQPVLNWREAQYYGRYGEVELHLLDFLCDRDRDAIDVGANEGSYIHFMRGCSRHVLAFEPIPFLAAALARKFRRGVTIRALALSRTPGVAILRIPVVDGVVVSGCATLSAAVRANYADCHEISVPTAPLDALYSGDVGFIKIDVEGHEEAVLDGARDTLSRCRPKLLVEALDHYSPGCVNRIAAFFRRLDYRGYFIYKHRLLPIDRFDRQVMQRREDFPKLAAGLETRGRFDRFVYNFLYFPASTPDLTLRQIEARLAWL